MNTTAFRRIGTVAGAAAITITGTITGTPASASAERRDTAQDRPCFMVRSHWNNAEGPQPTCPIPMWQQQASASDKSGTARPAPSARIGDFMP
jgi:hypothetical protein